MVVLDLLHRLQRVREQLTAFPVPAASRKTGNPEYEVLKAEEEDAAQAVRDAGYCPECGSERHDDRACSV